ncbi:MAG TPA: hypothetical protein VFJ02_20110, partial [Vicinamibacterales bacterium]|nr:hypothetical protein [Vicinamibacterales bacterium]
RPTASTPLRSRAALLALTQFSYLMDVGDRRQLATVFGQLATVVERVPVARLSIRNGWRAMGQAADEVLALATADS